MTNTCKKCKIYADQLCNGKTRYSMNECPIEQKADNLHTAKYYAQ